MAKKRVKVYLVLTISKEIEAASEDNYEKVRDGIINKLSEEGWNVDLTAEEDPADGELEESSPYG